MSVVLGIDTSNYTTSLAVYSTENNGMIQEKKLLPVKPGEKGLRQSDAVFHHVQQLPQLMDKLWDPSWTADLKAVGVSNRPREVEGSYMPCFTVGQSLGAMIGKMAGCPVYSFSHQTGHIAAALFSAEKLSLRKSPFLAFHVSGGTTEALLVTPEAEKVLSCRLVAETLDLNAGQLIDRVGVSLGIPFPAGPGLEQLALTWTGEPIKEARPSMKGANCCLSGAENLCAKFKKEGKSPAYIAAFCLEYVKKSLDQMCSSLLQIYGNLPLVFAGGVMSNSILRKFFSEKYGAFFAEPRFSSDNAGGIAVLTSIKAGLL